MARNATRSAHILWCAATLVLLFAPGRGQVVGAAEPAEDAAAASIHFANGDFASGHLWESNEVNVIRWRGKALAGDLTFPAGVIQSIEFNRTIDVRNAGPYFFELAGGDAISGQLLALNEREVVVKTPGIGVVTLERAVVQRFFRSVPGEVLFAGPGAVAGWQTAGPPKAWREEGGHLATDKADAELSRSFTLPRAARYDLELSWSERPNFELAVGMDKTRPKLRPNFKLEIWGGDLVIVRESERNADFRVLQRLTTGSGRVTLQIIFDQTQGRVVVFGPTGERLASLHVPGDNDAAPVANAKAKPTLFKLPAAASAPAGGVQLLNRKGNLKVERLVISHWTGTTPDSPSALAAQPAAETVWLKEGDTDGQTVKLVSFDREKRQFTVRAGDVERSIDEKLLQEVLFARPEEPPGRIARVSLVTGERVSGKILRIGQENLRLEVAGIREPVECPLKSLQSIVGLKAIEAADATGTAGGTAECRLAADDVSLHGQLTAVSAELAQLMFQPRYSQTAAPLAANFSGKLIYRESPPPQPAPPSPAPVANAPAVRVLNGVRTLLGARYTPATRPAAPGDCVLHLRSGDTLTCRVERIDELGVWLKSSQTAAKYVPHSKIKVLELRQDIPSAKIDKTKSERLLTLPRMQRDNPPQQLIRSLDGDYLRGRLVAMDEQELQVEVQLDKRTIERGQVARIIWLHPDEIVESEADSATASRAAAVEPETDGHPAGVRVQVVSKDERRLTFFAQRLEDAALVGVSDVLGECRSALDQANTVLIGRAIEQSAATLAFHQWKLHPALEPLPVPEEGADPSGSEGLESFLVGKPAPAIDLEFLSGKRFRLPDYKGKVLILDFWASWCGPCLQTMPQVDAVAHEFADHGVMLVGINLEETPERIKQALERLKLDMPVAIDRDGRVAERYGATAIPQTVIIDREGKLARLYIGGSPRFDATLRQALKSLLNLPAEEKSN